MSLFNSYRFIDAAHIVRTNVDQRHVDDDVRSLLYALYPLSVVAQNALNSGQKLNDEVVKRIMKATDLVDILLMMGYRRDGREFIFQGRQNRDEVEREVRKFYQELLNIQRHGYDDLRSFLRTNPVSSNRRDDPPLLNRGSSSLSFSSRSSTTLYSRENVEEQNSRTLEIVQRLRRSLTTQYNGNLSSGFIRRKIAQQHFKSIHPYTETWQIEQIDISIDDLIRILKDNRRDREKSFSDEVYVECLIRTDFNHREALKMFNEKRPVITPPVKERPPLHNRIEQLPKALTDAIRQHSDTLRNQQVEIDMKQDHKWKDMGHLCVGLQSICRRYPNPAPNSDEEKLRFSKICRLLSGEIWNITTSVNSTNIEILAREICEMSLDESSVLDVLTIRSRYEQLMTANIADGGLQSFVKTCPVCAEKFPRSQMETMLLCQDMICEGCVQNYYRVTIPSIRDENSLRSLACPSCSCQIPEDQEERLMFFMMLQTEIGRWFKNQTEITDLYNENIFFATRDRQTKNCGNPTCNEIFHIGTNTTVGAVRCPKCNFQQCRMCNREWKAEHARMACDAYTTWLARNDPDNPDVIMRRLIESEGVVCPYPDCSEVFIYEAGGCEHYTCLKCRRPFCANCSSLWVNVTDGQQCPMIAACRIKGEHGHCPPNCFREVRDAPFNTYIEYLQANGVNVEYESANPDVMPNGRCELSGCVRSVVEASGNRLCELCYKKYLWKYLWNREIEPWGLYYPNNLAQLLIKESIDVNQETPFDQLVQLARQHLSKYLGRPNQTAREELDNERLYEDDTDEDYTDEDNTDEE